MVNYIQIVGKVGGYFFPGGRIVKLFKVATNSTSPLSAVKNVTLTVVDCCAPPPLRLAAHCIATGAVIGAAVVSPNPITIGSVIHLITEIYEIC